MKKLATILIALAVVALSKVNLQAQCSQPISAQMIVSTFGICQGNASICCLVTNPGNYVFKWSNGYISSSNSESCNQNLTPGETYEVTVYDLNQSGCEATFSAYVPTPEEAKCPEEREREERRRE